MNFSILCLPACMLSHFSHVQLFETQGTVAHQAPLSMGFSRQEHCGGLPCPPPGDLPDPGYNSLLLCLLHCRWILYTLSYLRSPFSFYFSSKTVPPPMSILSIKTSLTPFTQWPVPENLCTILNLSLPILPYSGHPLSPSPWTLP